MFCGDKKERFCSGCSNETIVSFKVDNLDVNYLLNGEVVNLR